MWLSGWSRMIYSRTGYETYIKKNNSGSGSHAKRARQQNYELYKIKLQNIFKLFSEQAPYLVLRIWNILVRIRIYDFWPITFWRYIYIICQRKKNIKRSHKTVGIQCLSYYFCLMIEGSGNVPLTNGSGSGGQKTYGSYGSGSVTLGRTHVIKTSLTML